MIKDPENFIDKNELARSLNNATESYEQAAFLQKEIANRLLERLDLLRIPPKTILDLGSGIGHGTFYLEKYYKKAQIVAVDIAEKMLMKIKRSKRWFDRKRYVCADFEQLPFANDSFDLIYSNLALHWSNNIPQTIQELHRILKPGGFLFFTLFGKDTLYELKESWAEVDNHIHVHQFVDMHDVGDILLRSKFIDPVVDMEFLTITYNDIRKFLCDMKDLGMQNIAKGRQKGLTSKRKFSQFINEYEKRRTSEGLIPVTYEVIYGHAIGAEKVSDKKPREISIPISSIKRKI